MSTTSNQDPYFLKLIVAAQDYDIIIRATFQKFLEGRSGLFIPTNFQTVVRGAQDHPNVNMISRFVPWTMNYSFLVSKHQKNYQAVCNKAPNTFDSTTCRPAARLKSWLLNWYRVIQRLRETHCGIQLGKRVSLAKYLDIWLTKYTWGHDEVKIYYKQASDDTAYIYLVLSNI